MAGGDPRSPYAVEEGHTIWAFPPFFIFCSASVQQGLDAYESQYRARKVKAMARQAKALGYTLVALGTPEGASLDAVTAPIP